MTVDTRQVLSIIHRPKSFSVNTYNFVHAGQGSLSGFHPSDTNNRAPIRRLLGDTEGFSVSMREDGQFTKNTAASTLGLYTL